MRRSDEDSEELNPEGFELDPHSMFYFADIH